MCACRIAVCPELFFASSFLFINACALTTLLYFVFLTLEYFFLRSSASRAPACRIPVCSELFFSPSFLFIYVCVLTTRLYFVVPSSVSEYFFLRSSASRARACRIPVCSERTLFSVFLIYLCLCAHNSSLFRRSIFSLRILLVVFVCF